MAERDAVRHHLLPGVPMLLCLFPVPRAMGREVTTSKMNLPESQLAAALSALQKLTGAKPERESTEYNNLREDLHANFPASVGHCFEANWHPCRLDLEWSCAGSAEIMLGTFGE